MDPILRYAAALIAGAAVFFLASGFGSQVMSPDEPGNGMLVAGFSAITALVGWYAALRGLRMLGEPQ